MGDEKDKGILGNEKESAPANGERDKLYSDELLEEDFEMEKDLEHLPIQEPLIK